MVALVTKRELSERLVVEYRAVIQYQVVALERVAKGQRHRSSVVHGDSVEIHTVNLIGERAGQGRRRPRQHRPRDTTGKETTRNTHTRLNTDLTLHCTARLPLPTS